MNRLTSAGLLAALVMITGGPAHADSWCVRDSAGTIEPICAFSSAQDCIHAAILVPSGSICQHEADLAPAATPAARSESVRSKKHDAGHARPQHWADRKTDVAGAERSRITPAPAFRSSALRQGR